MIIYPELSACTMYIYIYKYTHNVHTYIHIYFRHAPYFTRYTVLPLSPVPTCTYTQKFSTYSNHSSRFVSKCFECQINLCLIDRKSSELYSKSLFFPKKAHTHTDWLYTCMFTWVGYAKILSKNNTNVGMCVCVCGSVKGLVRADLLNKINLRIGNQDN